MRPGEGGRAQSAAVVVALVAAVAAVAAAGIAFGAMDSTSEERTAEEILSDVEATYADADSVVTDAVVTVEAGNRTTTFEVSATTAGDDRARLNVSEGDRYLLRGLDGGTLWLSESTTGVTGVIEHNETAVTASLRADTTDALDDALDAELDGPPTNLTLGELFAGETGNTGIGSIFPGGDGKHPANWTGVDHLEQLGEFDVPERFNTSLSVPGEYGEYNWTALRERFNESLAERFDRPEIAVERVGTTTVDGTEANELLVSSPDVDVETRLWTGAETDAVLRQETTLPGLTVTVDVRETRFDVSPAEDTFEPPGTTALASLTAVAGQTPADFGAATPFEPALPADTWRFERGVALSGSAPVLTDLPGIEETTVAAGAYTDGDEHLAVGQVDRELDLSVFSLFGAETVTVDSREVVLLSGRHGTVGVFTEAGATVIVGGTVDRSRFRDAIEGIAFETPGR